MPFRVSDCFDNVVGKKYSFDRENFVKYTHEAVAKVKFAVIVISTGFGIYKYFHQNVPLSITHSNTFRVKRVDAVIDVFNSGF